MASESTVRIDSHRLRLTNLDKAFYPSTGTTKAEVAQYYTRIAPVMVPHCAGRPATRKRWVDGVGTAAHPRQAFFSKDLDAGTPPWVVRAELEHSDHRATYPVIEERATLVWFAQIAALEVHLPQWRMDSAGQPRNPDRLVLDLDPGEGVDLATVAQVALLVRPILSGMGLDCFPVTSGSKGIHLYAPLDGTVTSAAASSLAKELARSLEADHPDLVLSQMNRAERAGKVFLDWSQNNAKKTTIAPYSLRGTLAPRVAAPRTWAELQDPDLRQLHPDEVLAAIDRRADPMAALALPLDQDRPATTDRLTAYRSKRDPGRTPEPVPAEAPGPSPELTFVIQEHRARRLHYDFRLAHGGVLVSWALPKGVPTDSQVNHLAVPTEDHPMAYADFAGTIPAGQYGAGEVAIWDRGTYTVEKWREGSEVIVTLTGAPDGGLATHGPGRQARFALVRTGGSKDGWLIHLMRPADQEAAGARPEHAQSRGPRPNPAPSSSPGIPAAPEPNKPRSGRPAPPPRAMLATAGTAADLRDGEWALERKWDGVRAVLQVEDGDLRIFGRSGREATAHYPDLSDLPDSVHAARAVLDGEIVALDALGRPHFSVLQPRMQAGPAGARAAAQRQPVDLMLFDVLSVDGHDLMEYPYHRRRQMLQTLIAPAGRIHLPPTLDGPVAEALADTRQEGLEGLVAKRTDSPYQPGRRARTWVKIRHQRTQEVVIGGWRPGKGSRSGAVGSLLLGVPDGEGLRYVGRVGTGFTDHQARQWARELAAAERATSPLTHLPAADGADARWSEPTRVGEVAFTEWSPAGRLRHPVWRGWRPDKTGSEVTFED
ncbi:MAG TPA: ATP-dependent DNA ligase [Beutenbergiaceae bacterium]|nr:ATP-dependent DNA ligase [Beutenbergiaceae bacterium]